MGCSMLCALCRAFSALGMQAADDCAHPLHQLAQNMDTMPQANGKWRTRQNSQHLPCIDVKSL